jgi:5'-nucleotidase
MNATNGNAAADSDAAPLILVCNDDGIDAPGIHALANVLDGLGEVVVVAPESEQSAVGHAITVRDPVRAHETPFEVASGPVRAWAVSGTPADCIKLAASELLDRQPALVVSGINRGPNTAVNVLYSGTVSAATEASILGIDAIAVSLCDWTPDDYGVAAGWSKHIAARVLRTGLPAGVLLNVNVPARPAEQVQGAAVTRQARARWEESFVARTDPLGRDYYWLAGDFVDLDDGGATDLAAIDEGYVSITPLQHDMTAHEVFADLEGEGWAEDPPFQAGASSDAETPSQDGSSTAANERPGAPPEGSSDAPK